MMTEPQSSLFVVSLGAAIAFVLWQDVRFALEREWFRITELSLPFTFIAFVAFCGMVAGAYYQLDALTAVCNGLMVGFGAAALIHLAVGGVVTIGMFLLVIAAICLLPLARR